MSKKKNHAQAVITGNSSPDSATTSTDNAALLELAYELWLGRGCPIGSPEVDWFRAEELLKSRVETPSEPPAESPAEQVQAMAAMSGT